MKDLIKKLLSEEVDKRELMLFDKLNQKKKTLKNKEEIVKYIEHISKFLGLDPEIPEYYYQLWKANYRKEGGYKNLPPEELIGPKELPARTMSNTKVRAFVRAKAPFKGSNLKGGWYKDGRGVEYYTVISYGWYPIYLFKDNHWYRVTDSYSSSTGRQMSNANPVKYDSEIKEDVIWVSRREMEKLQEGATYEQIMRGKVEGLVQNKEKFISTRSRFAQDWGYGDDYTPSKVKFRITDIRQEGDLAIVDIMIEDAGSREMEQRQWGQTHTNRMIPSQGGYLRGEIPNVTKEKVEKTIKNKIIYNFKDYVGRWPEYEDGEYDLDPTKIRFNFTHKHENPVNEQITIDLGTRTRYMSRDKYYSKMDKEARKQEKEDLKAIARETKQAEKEAERYKKEETRNLFSSKRNLMGHKLSKEEIQKQEQDYEANKNNSNLLKDQSDFDTETRFIVINKIASYLGRNPNNWFMTKLNKLFGRGSQTINTSQLLELIMDPKIGGFDKFMEMYDTGFPNVDIWK